MELAAYLAFVLLSAAQVATPGPSTLFIVNNAIAHGWRRALSALSGDLVAIALLATLSVVGLGALLERYPAAFLALRLAGASYIIWLGWGFLRPPPPQPGPNDAGPAHRQSGRALWLHSFGVGISNPKAVLFFAALFPQFLPAESGPVVLALLVSTFVAVKFIVLGGYAIGSPTPRTTASQAGACEARACSDRHHLSGVRGADDRLRPDSHIGSCKSARARQPSARCASSFSLRRNQRNMEIGIDSLAPPGPFFCASRTPVCPLETIG
jgi:homoserine/homoserine lactone efflux protein